MERLEGSNCVEATIYRSPETYLPADSEYFQVYVGSQKKSMHMEVVHQILRISSLEKPLEVQGKWQVILFSSIKRENLKLENR